MREIHPLLLGLFSSFLLIPVFFWLGGKLFLVRVDVFPLLAAAGTLLLFFSFFKKK